MASWEACPRAYALGYALGLSRPEAARPGGKLGVHHLGSAAHAGVAAHYWGSDITEGVEGFYGKLWRDWYPDEESDWREHQTWTRDSRDYAAAVALGYPEWAKESKLDVGVDLLAIEQTWVYEDQVTGLIVVGTWDQVVRDHVTGRLRVRDLKTVKNDSELDTPIHPDTIQTSVYNWALEEFTGELPDGFQHIRARRIKQESTRAGSRMYELAPTAKRMDEMDLAITEARVYHTWEEMNRVYEVASSDTPARDIGRSPLTRAVPTRDCGRCRFKDICPRIRDPYAQEAIDELFIQRRSEELRTAS